MTNSDERSVFGDDALHLPPEITAWPSPRGFELYVKDLALHWGQGLEDLQVTSLEPIEATDGTSYTMDVVTRFRALGLAQFVVLWECKRKSRPVERSDVQILRDKLNELGAHKGVMMSVSGYQSGAVEYAKKHGIATVQIFDQVAKYLSFSNLGPVPARVSSTRVIGRYATWMFHSTDGEGTTVDVAEQHPTLIRQELGLIAEPSEHPPGCRDCSDGTRVLKPTDNAKITRISGIQRVHRDDS
ncbi:restriction endonuclease [Streptomyces sp. NPDC051657]|uniref:restriction endonuclease n=1 Tax=unclassified Streptomyces TaxID=2593676 RepID=UPI00343E2E40